jgi:peroxiredoxin
MIDDQGDPPTDTPPGTNGAPPVEAQGEEPRTPSRKAAWLGMGAVAVTLGLLWLVPALEDPHTDEQPGVAGPSDDEDALAIGKPARLDFKMKDMNGVDVMLASFKGKVILLNFWATWCGPCTAEFPEILDTWRMYRKRPFELVTVSINYPDEEKAVRKFLEEQHAASRNYVSGSMDPYELMAAFDKDWNGGVPYSMVIAPGGQVLYKGNGQLDILKTRRLILASFPDDNYVGQNAYWNSK